MSRPNHYAVLGRAGYATRGLVYILLGGLAAVSAIGASEVDSQSAIDVLLAQPFGQVWIWLVVAGLAFFVLWRVAQGVLNADRRAHDLKGWGVRIGALASGVAYGGLALYAAQRALHVGASGGSGGDTWTDWLLAQPFGRYLVGLAGLVVIGVGLSHVYYGLTKGYEKHLDARACGQPAIGAVASYGLVARGILFAIVGGLVFWGAYSFNQDEGGSLSDAMIWLRSLPFGPWLYGAAAMGLCAYGAYALIQARYRHIDGPSMAEAQSQARARASAALS